MISGTTNVPEVRVAKNGGPKHDPPMPATWTGSILTKRPQNIRKMLPSLATAPTLYLRRRAGLAGGASTFAGLSSCALI